jgi:hypothetical protein
MSGDTSKKTTGAQVADAVVRASQAAADIIATQKDNVAEQLKKQLHKGL